MAWYTGLGSKLQNALSRGLDLVLSRLATNQGSLRGVDLEIQKRVPDLPPPAQAALLEHVSRAAEAASIMRDNPDKPLDDPERIPVNELLADRLQPGDRFIYSGDVGNFFGTEQPGRYMRVDVASPIALSHDEVSSIAESEAEKREKDSPEWAMNQLPGAGGGWEFQKPVFRLHATVRTY